MGRGGVGVGEIHPSVLTSELIGGESRTVVTIESSQRVDFKAMLKVCLEGQMSRQGQVKRKSRLFSSY